MNFTSSIIGKLTFTLLLLAASGAAAQDEPYEYAPVDFTDPLTLSRGEIAPIIEGGYYLSREDSCHLATTGWGWNRRQCLAIDAMLVAPAGALDSVIIEKPNTDGYVKFDDWNADDRDAQVQAIWDALDKSIAQQGENLGVDIKLEQWLVEPTLDQENNYLYYATRMNWDGAPQINIKATVFDRRGYVAFVLTPLDGNFAPDRVKSAIEEVLSAYTPNAAETYADFAEGDKVASVGVLGVLAGIVGVKYGKALAVGLGALLIGLAKKLWFLLLVPLVALKNVIFKKKD